MLTVSLCPLQYHYEAKPSLYFIISYQELNYEHLIGTLGSDSIVL